MTRTGLHGTWRDASLEIPIIHMCGRNEASVILKAAEKGNLSMRTIRLLLFALAVCTPLSAQQAPEPVLREAQLPMYPALARQARVSGDVKASFTVDATGNVISVEVLS